MSTHTTKTASTKSTTNGKAPTAPKSGTAVTKEPISTAHSGSSQGAGKPIVALVQPAAPQPVAEPPQRDARMPIHQRTRRQLVIAAKRWSTFLRITKGWSPEVDVAIAEVSEGMLAAIEAVSKLPDGFVPSRRAGGGGAPSAQLVPGALVNITDKAAAKYKDILDEADLKSLEVMKVVGKKIVFRTQGGDRVIIPRGHVKPTGQMKAVNTVPVETPAN